MKRLIGVVLVVAVVLFCSGIVFATGLTQVQILQEQLTSAQAQKTMQDANYAVQSDTIAKRIANIQAQITKLTPAPTA